MYICVFLSLDACQYSASDGILNVKKHKCKVLKDCRWEGGVSGLSVSGCALGEGLGYNLLLVHCRLSFKSLPALRYCVRHSLQRHTDVTLRGSWILEIKQESIFISFPFSNYALWLNHQWFGPIGVLELLAATSVV